MDYLPGFNVSVFVVGFARLVVVFAVIGGVLWWASGSSSCLWFAGWFGGFWCLAVV